MVLNDPAWQGVSPATDFWQVQPDEGEASTQKTEVFIGFLEDALYIGLVAYDDNPDGIIVTDARRDRSLNESDSFRVIIDGMLDRQNGFVFGTNPVGMEYDAQVIKEAASGAFGGTGFNLNWNASWSVEAQITEIGWSAEMRIPFKALRFRKGDVQTWGINFQRNIRRNNEQTYWAPLSRQHDLNRVSEAGTVEGITPPRTRNLKFTPYGLVKAGRGPELDGTETDTEIGFDAKYSITPSLTLDLTYNTDFAQVEADEQQVNLDRFNLFFPEKRPFFLENAGQFTVGNSREAQLFFSRRIGIGEGGAVIPIKGGARISGKMGEKTNVGFLYMSSEAVDGVAPENQFTVARVNQELGKRSSIGAIFVERNGDGSHDKPDAYDKNRAYGIDGRLAIGEYILLNGWASKTDTAELEGDDHAFSIRGNYDSPEWSHGIEYTEVARNFNPEVGFLSRSEYRKFATNSLMRIRPKDLWGLMEVRPHYSYRRYEDFDGFQETGYLHLDIHWEWKNGYEFHTGYNIFTDGIKDAFEIVDDVWIEPGTYHDSEIALYFKTDESAPLSFGVETSIGGKFGGDRITLSPYIDYRIGDKFSSSLSVGYNDYDLPVEGGDFSVSLTRLRLSYAFTPKILLQALMQYNDEQDTLATNLRFSWLRTANTGLYLVYNEFDERGIDALPKGREFILKYSYMFDVFK
ncbi:MAG: carbohydrate binding family 9 domain-containing protein [Gammaproteobacteria bacterium]|nr:carbohydrate binding family 9 domain-containing protein [Gammaproteobacteria bacterium]